MSKNNVKERVMAIIAEHAIKARNSQYDIGVAITAIASAETTVTDLHESLFSTDDYAQEVVGALRTLRDEYNDTDGQYTNGKGILGSLTDDIYVALSKE